MRNLIAAIMLLPALCIGQLTEFTTSDFLDSTAISPTATFDMTNNAAVRLPDDTSLGGLDLANSVRTNFVIVRTLSDWPTPVGGVILPLSNTIYEANGMVDMGTNFLSIPVTNSGVWIRGSALSLDSFIYRGTGFFIRAAGPNIGLSDFTIICTNASFASFEYTGTNASFLNINNVRVNDSDSILSVSNYTIANIDGLLVDGYRSQDYGIRFLGAGDSLLNVNDLIMVRSGSNSVAINMGDSVWINPTFDECFIDVPPGGIGFLALTNSANVASNGLGAIRSTIFRNTGGTGTNLVGVTLNDQRWELSDNPGVAASSAITSMYITNQVTVSIASVDTPVNVTGLGQWVQADSAGFLFSTNGVLTYNKAFPKTLYISASMTMEPTSGNRDLAAYIALNGTPLVLSKFPLAVGNGSPAPFLPQITVSLELGDELTLMVENESNNSDINVNTVKFIVTGD